LVTGGVVVGGVVVGGVLTDLLLQLASTITAMMANSIIFLPCIIFFVLGEEVVAPGFVNRYFFCL
jgi:hypothetical protein